jgi:hypothetical protein
LGALLKDPRTGEQCSVHYENLRKLNIDELLVMLPTHFDSEIANKLTFRYNSASDPEKPHSDTGTIDDAIHPDPNFTETDPELSSPDTQFGALKLTRKNPHSDFTLPQEQVLGPQKSTDLLKNPNSQVQDPQFDRDPEYFQNLNVPDPDPDPHQQVPSQQNSLELVNTSSRKLRSGKIFSLNNVVLQVNSNIVYTNMSFSTVNKISEANFNAKPCLKNRFRPTPTVYAESDQCFNGQLYLFNSHLKAENVKEDDPCENRTYSSRFKSPLNGTLTIALDHDKDSKKLKFTHIIVHFY